MRRDVFWQPWGEIGLEHLWLETDAAGVQADGLIVGLAVGRPFRVRYRLRCDAAWRVREVRVADLDAGRDLHLLADGNGTWTLGDGTPLPDLADCIDVDLSATPFTNTLPIRRLALAPGELADLAVAYVAVPELTVAPDPQRYRCLERRPDRGRYRYESLDSDFAAEIAVDADSVVLDYPGLFRRVRGA